LAVVLVLLLLPPLPLLLRECVGGRAGVY
jgi:hypothetical protein